MLEDSKLERLKNILEKNKKGFGDTQLASIEYHDNLIELVDGFINENTNSVLTEINREQFKIGDLLSDENYKLLHLLDNAIFKTDEKIQELEDIKEIKRTKYNDSLQVKQNELTDEQEKLKKDEDLRLDCSLSVQQKLMKAMDEKELKAYCEENDISPKDPILKFKPMTKVDWEKKVSKELTKDKQDEIKDFIKVNEEIIKGYTDEIKKLRTQRSSLKRIFKIELAHYEKK
jgi:hypothetical protein